MIFFGKHIFFSLDFYFFSSKLERTTYIFEPCHFWLQWYLVRCLYKIWISKLALVGLMQRFKVHNSCFVSAKYAHVVYINFKIWNLWRKSKIHTKQCHHSELRLLMILKSTKMKMFFMFCPTLLTLLQAFLNIQTSE